MFGEFRGFLLKTNALALAVGVIIGIAAGAVVTSLVNDVIMPPIGALMGGVDFKNLYFAIGTQYATLEEAVKANAPIVRYGNFIQSVVDFLIVAFCIFMMVKQVNRFSPPPKPVAK